MGGAYEIIFISSLVFLFPRFGKDLFGIRPISHGFLDDDTIRGGGRDGRGAQRERFIAQAIAVKSVRRFFCFVNWDAVVGCTDGIDVPVGIFPISDSIDRFHYYGNEQRISLEKSRRDVDGVGRFDSHRCDAFFRACLFEVTTIA